MVLDTGMAAVAEGGVVGAVVTQIMDAVPFKIFIAAMKGNAKSWAAVMKSRKPPFWIASSMLLLKNGKNFGKMRTRFLLLLHL